MDDLAKKLYQIMCEIWLNYKHHSEKEKGEEFWNSWISDLTVIEEAYESDKVAIAFIQEFSRGLARATERSGVMNE